MTIKTSGSAFPYVGHHSTESGMTLRDYFACQTLQTMNLSFRPYDTTSTSAADAYHMADAMLKARG